ncbi:MAG: DUF523 domain-containing protein [Clostridiales bacterium]|nr:DUF523 domain-containing protein [Clostridiales bacterium]
MTILVSACLLGENCKYNGGNNLNERVLRYVAGHEVLPVCPEMLSGLGAPRKPVELREGRVVTADGDDCTDAFRAGVRKALEGIAGTQIDLAILQSRSPTCGVKQIYDGTFSRRKIDGQGLLARALKERGIPLMDAEDVPDR